VYDIPVTGHSHLDKTLAGRTVQCLDSRQTLGGRTMQYLAGQ
jgi:hypothetical protein